VWSRPLHRLQHRHRLGGPHDPDAANRVGALPAQEIGSPYFVRIDPVTGQGPMAIDTAAYKVGDRTMNGGVRNARQFWKDWSATYSDTLSEANAARVSLKQSPIVDDVWIKSFPEHAAYKGETLVHHHLDYGPKAVPLPGTVHSRNPGWGIWHPDHAGN
jgi:filamentous hemagglutinin